MTMQLVEKLYQINVRENFSSVSSKAYLKYYFTANVSLPDTEFSTHAKFNPTSFLSRGMGNICGDGDISEESSPEPETFRRHRSERREYRERYPGVHYFEENRLRDDAYRGNNHENNHDPKCSCYGPTPDERFFIQRCPHPQVLNTTISKDLAEITEENKAKAQELRQERIHLIKSKVKEITGKDIEFDTGMINSLLITFNSKIK